MITQFRLYMHEYQRGTFAINAPNDVVREVTGREPETFDAIAQRVVLDNPEAVRSPRNWTTAVAGILRILVTRTPKTAAIEEARDLVTIADGVYADSSEEWASLHMPATNSAPNAAPESVS